MLRGSGERSRPHFMRPGGACLATMRGMLVHRVGEALAIGALGFSFVLAIVSAAPNAANGSVAILLRAVAASRTRGGGARRRPKEFTCADETNFI